MNNQEFNDRLREEREKESSQLVGITIAQWLAAYVVFLRVLYKGLSSASMLDPAKAHLFVGWLRENIQGMSNKQALALIRSLNSVASTTSVRHNRLFEAYKASNGIVSSVTAPAVGTDVLKASLAGVFKTNAVGLDNIYKASMVRAANNAVTTIKPFIDYGFKTGMKPDVFARMVTLRMTPNDPLVADAIRKLLHFTGDPAVELRRMALDTGIDLRMIDGKAVLFHDAKRLSAHEVNRMVFEADVQHAIHNPAVSLVKWRLSPSHMVEDVCDLYATHNSGFGPGVYTTMHVPILPHPWCRCFLEYILRGQERWHKPKASSAPKKRYAGTVHMGSATRAFRQRQFKTFRNGFIQRGL